MNWVWNSPKKITHGKEKEGKLLDSMSHIWIANQTTLRFHLTPVRHGNYTDEDAEKKATLIFGVSECKLLQTLWKSVSNILKKMRNISTNGPAVLHSVVVL
jgi:hypothetical protein